MKIRERIARLLLKSSYGQSMAAKLIEGDAYNPETSAASLVQRYKSWAFACADRNAKTVAGLEYKLYAVKPTKDARSRFLSCPVSKRVKDRLLSKTATRRKMMAGADVEEILQHPVLDILSKVNDYQNEFDLKYLASTCIDIAGNAFWRKERVLGRVDKLYALQPQLVTPKIEGSEIVRYEYGFGTKKTVIAKSDMIHIMFPNISDPFRGMSKIEAALSACDLSDNMNTFELNLLVNGGRPSLALNYPENAMVTEEEETRARANFRRYFAGSKNSHNLFIGRGGVELKEIGFSPREMSFLAGRKWSREEIAAVFGVPMSKLELSGVVANSKVGDNDYLRQTILPLAWLIVDALNQDLLPEYDDPLLLDFDDPCQEDREYSLRERETHIRIGMTTVNEERAALGLDPVPWGDEPKQSPSPFGANPTLPDGKSKRVGPKNDLPKDDFVPTILKSQLVIFFEQMVDEVARKTETQIKSAKSIPVDVLNAIFDSKRWTDQFKADVMPFVKGLLTQGIIDSLEKVNPEAFFNANAPEVLRALEGREGQITTVIDNSRSEIRKLITEGIEDGLGPKQIARNIRGSFDTRHHAETVARTETIWAHNEGTVQGWKQSGVVAAKQWDTAPDERRCEFCGDMHGRVISLDANFYGKGDTMEGREGGQLGFGYDVIDHPPLHPNCRCSLIPILIED